MGVQAAAGRYRAIGDRAAGAAGPVGPGVAFDTDVLRQLFGQQHAVAADIDSAGQATTAAPEKVAQSHGSVCAATNAAVADAVQARTATATSMHVRSGQLAEGLDGAADAYDCTAEQERAKLENQMPPR